MCANFNLSQLRGSPQIAVPNFVPTLDQKPWQVVAMGQGSESPVPAQRINTIANHRVQS